ncbi:isocitrate/isopropylmalate family dehydrogenase [Ralstonia solanacearum]|nr:tartrate dehydrogenase [Ralstonia solanacearum P673]MCL9849467.1 isocitrate/isopropylmalate family dehydrogenase [Ralstonia solanacearum]MCL9853325.1 isocitrate/isopropylmalate family dehydrogenase [Ralstonia solanacearum]MCL9858066.1 isocitrate/isopropylmalate family dehydrogenase [Ralstonia solanacearum]MCL9862969.1 isocitrate/isopropylmalate family dehydrogenase [Ralstonia solanacearum]
MSSYRIAVIPGDGIGKEAVPEGPRVLDAAARRFGFALRCGHFDFASSDTHARHGKLRPDDRFDTLRGYDALFFGAVGWPDTGAVDLGCAIAEALV